MPKLSTPKVAKKTAKPKVAKNRMGDGQSRSEGRAMPQNGAGARAGQETMELEPPTTPVETPEETKSEGQATGSPTESLPGATVNIAKLQAMSMNDLNHMARDMGIENFGTMRKHEVIFHILQKNAERSGILFSEGVLEVLAEGFGFLRSQSFNYLPCPEDIYVSPSQIRRFDLQTGNLVAGQIRPPKEKERFFARERQRRKASARHGRC